MIISYVKNVIKKLVNQTFIVNIVIIKKLMGMKEFVWNMEFQKLELLRHQIMIWIWMKEKQNMRIIIIYYVKNVIKKLVNQTFIVIIVIIRKLMIMNKSV